MNVFIRHYRWTLIAVTIVTAISLFGSLRYLKTESGILDLYSEDDPMQKNYLAYIERFGTTEDLVAVIESEDPLSARAMIEALAKRLSLHRDLIERIYYRFDPEPVREHAFYFLNDSELDDLEKRMRDANDPLHRALFDKKPHEFFKALARTITETTKSAASPKEELKKLNDLMQALAQAAAGKALKKNLWQDFFTSGRDSQSEIFDEEGYIEAKPGFYLLFIHPTDIKNETKKTRALVQAVREDIAAVSSQFPSVHAGVTGAPALNADQFAIAETDMTYASIFDLLFVAVLFMLAFHEAVRPLFAVIALAIGIAWSFGLTTLSVGHLNLFTLPFAIMLVGMGIDYGIHLVSRYEEERLHGLDPVTALQKTLKTAGKSIAWGSLTTAFAFSTTLFVELRGFAELGWIVGSGLLLCMASAIITLPVFLYLRDRKRENHAIKRFSSHGYESSLFRRWGRFVGQHPFWLALIVLLVSGLAVGFLASPQFRFTFDYNLLNLQAKGSEAVRYEAHLVESKLSPRTAIWMPSPRLSRAEIEAKIAVFEGLATVERVESLYSLLPSDQEPTRQRLLRSAGIYPRPMPIGHSSTQEWQEALAQLDTAFRSIERRAFSAGRIDLLQDSQALRNAVKQIKTALQDPQRTESIQSLNEPLFTSFRRFFAAAVRADPITLSDYPEVIRNRFLSEDNHQAIYIVPNVSIWERDELTRFVNDVRQVEKNVTGNPIQMYETLEQVRMSYEQSAIYAFIAIFLVSFLDFRKIQSALLATITIGVGIVWLLGFMSAGGLDFNMANLIAVPLVLGIGIDNIMHLLHRYKENPDWEEIFHHTGKAVGITTLTNISSFVGIALSRHQGLASMGKIVLLGISLCFISSLTVLPLLLRLFAKSERRRG